MTAHSQDQTQQRQDGADGEQRERQVLTLGLLAAPGLARDMAENLAQDLPGSLSQRYPDQEWRVTVQEEPLAGASAGNVSLVEVARDRLLENGWDLAICLTDQPLLVGRHPETAYVSVSLGVGLVSVPALGVVGLEGKVREAVLRLVERLQGERPGRRRSSKPRRRVLFPRNIVDRHSPVGHVRAVDGETVRYITGVGSGNLRLVLGMVRANRPWRLIAGLSRALTGALGTGAFGLASTGVWQLAEGMHWARPIALSAAAVLGLCLSLIVAHRLWERVPEGLARERVVLFNTATTLTVIIGVLSLYLALLVIVTTSALALIPQGVFESQVGHAVGTADYLRLGVLVSMLATLGGALGSALETDQAVREAAYGYRPGD